MTWQDMLHELLELESGLSGWEMHFLGSIAKQADRDGWEPSPKQIAVIEKVYQERIES